jgi:hypothetical protein
VCVCVCVCVGIGGSFGLVLYSSIFLRKGNVMSTYGTCAQAVRSISVVSRTLLMPVASYTSIIALQEMRQ